MNIFIIFFFQNFIKIFSKTHQNAPNCTILKKFLEGACSRTLLANAWLRHANTPLLPKIF